MIKIITFDYGNEDLTSNTYILIDSKKDALVIDPGKEYLGIVDYLKKNELNLKGVLLTHVHYDHIRGIPNIISNYNAPIYCHFEDSNKFESSYLNCSKFMNCHFEIKLNPITLTDGEILSNLLEEDIKVIHTPFHTNGSVCYYLKESKILISGDTLFRFTVGRSDLPTSMPKETFASLRKLADLPNDVNVYPGHGDKTTIGFEKQHNKHFKYN